MEDLIRPPTNWAFAHPTDPVAKKLSDQLTSMSKKLIRDLSQTQIRSEREQLVRAYYRKFYTLTLKKDHQKAGLNRPPTRDIVLDFPWKDCKENRFICLKIWEKISS